MSASNEPEPPLTDEAICRMGRAVAPLPDVLPRPQDHADNPARWMFERLATYIKQFEARLDEEHESGGAQAGGAAPPHRLRPRRKRARGRDSTSVQDCLDT